jgi:hypothetical protein
MLEARSEPRAENGEAALSLIQPPSPIFEDPFHDEPTSFALLLLCVLLVN